MAEDNTETFHHLRERLIEEKPFLTSIRNCATRLKVRHILNIANKKQLKLLIKITHHVVAGDIPLKTDDFKKLLKAKKLSFLKREFERDKEVKELLKCGREKQLSVLYKLQSVLPYILSPIVSE